MSGYISHFQVYTGKESSTEKVLGARVVTDIGATIQHQNHHVYCDNLFSSLQLFTDLLSVGIYACGTIRSNCRNLLTPYLKRGFPKRWDSITLQVKNWRARHRTCHDRNVTKALSSRPKCDNPNVTTALFSMRP